MWMGKGGGVIPPKTWQQHRRAGDLFGSTSRTLMGKHVGNRHGKCATETAKNESINEGERRKDREE
jgi:hypothetical protein